MKKENIFSPLRSQAFTYDGVFADAVSRVCEGTFKKINMTALCDYFAQRADQFATGEFWGKMMRGMCLIATYKKDENLREIIENAAKEMMALQDKDGDISTVPKEKQPRGTHGSDLWERKYVLMGLLAYYELSGNEKALACARDLALYTAKQVGFSPKCSIYDTGWAFYGMESASILEVIMRTFAYTGDDELLAFGQYIIDCGACGRENLFEAIRAGKSPYRIGEGASPKDSIAKAYEMTSCIEGLVAFYNATGSEDALMLAKSYWESVKAEEITLLGSGGADKPHNLGPGIGEQWNRTAFEQTNPDISLMMETCVSVYWMRLSHALLCATGDSRYADAMEVTLYNAILGALKADGSFFEYFPRFNGTRNAKVNYSANVCDFDLSCCTANGPTGLALFAENAVMRTKGGYALNFYGNFAVREKDTAFVCKSLYPSKGEAEIYVSKAGSGGILLSFRKPAFALDFTMTVDGCTCKSTGENGYVTVLCHEGETVTVRFGIPLVCHTAPHGSNRAGDGFVAFTYGALLLALDSRLTKDPQRIALPCKVPKHFEVLPSPFGGFFSIKAHFAHCAVHFIDYASAGNDWNGTHFVSWIQKI